MSKSKPTLEGAKPLGRCELVIILYCTVITRIPKSLLSSMLDLSIRLCHGKTMMHEISLVFIRPESDHWLPLSLTHSLTPLRLVDLIDVTLACKDANSKLVEVFAVADIDAADHVGNTLLQTWELRFGHCSDFEHKVWSRCGS